MKNTQEERTYACPLCKRQFVRKWNLKNHMRGVHSGIEPYRCHGCDASFRWRTQLSIHLRRNRECASVHHFMEASVSNVCLQAEPNDIWENTIDFLMDDSDGIPEIQCSPTTSDETMDGFFSDRESNGTPEHIPAVQSFALDVFNVEYSDSDEM
uniref:C2H2-type domain-containing protein n=1 Tax=Rhodosorus marinus TaxID=101924 RepID=A0A7S0BHP2_9RHOD|mmetsp:Transcript_16854/g.24224  ORF Transcript_16854/g.24224 Transcript_16854/m.24224 type:complete len:154 (+) Transcript_16854:210-671(+)